LPPDVNVPDANDGAWGSGQNDVWVLGADSPFTKHRFDHWDGHAWTFASSPDTLGTSQVTQPVIWGSAANDVWAVGLAAGVAEYLTTQVAHYDGTAWSFAIRDTSPFSVTSVWTAGHDVLFSGGAGLQQTLLLRLRRP
jgi:hypothetical protein